MIHTNLPKIWQHRFFPDAPRTQCRCGNKMELKSLANMDKGAYNADIQRLYGAWLYLLLAPLLHQMHVVVHRPPVATRLPPASFPHLPLPHSLKQAPSQTQPLDLNTQEDAATAQPHAYACQVWHVAHYSEVNFVNQFFVRSSPKWSRPRECPQSL